MNILNLLQQKGDDLPGGWVTIYFYVLNFHVLREQRGSVSKGGKFLLNKLTDKTGSSVTDEARMIRNNFKQTFTG